MPGRNTCASMRVLAHWTHVSTRVCSDPARFPDVAMSLLTVWIETGASVPVLYWSLTIASFRGRRRGSAAHP